MADSSLVNRFMQAHSNNYTPANRTKSNINQITIHHVAGNATIGGLGALWQNPNRKGSSHYGVQHEEVGQYVLEKDIAWCNSNWESNSHAISIETSNSTYGPEWRVADDTLETLIKLVTDITIRNGLYPLVLGKNVTWHSMFKATNCPGPYLYGKLGYIVEEVNRRISGNAVVPEPIPVDGYYRVRLSKDNQASQIGAYTDKERAINSANLHPGYSVFDPSFNLIYTSATSISVGDNVMITAAYYVTGTKIPAWVKNTPHKVSKISGDKALLGYPNGISSWVALSGLVKA